MSVFHNNALIGASGQGGYQIERSLRFNSADSAYLNRTPASAGNRRAYTISMWIKRAKLGATSRLFGAYSSASAYFEAGFDANNILYWYYFTSTYAYQRNTSQVFRDSGAWMHLVFVFDSPNATAADRMKIYINGQQITAFSATVNPTQNFDCLWNSTSNNVIADLLYAGSPGSTFDGLMTEVHNIDGQALTPSSFGETNPVTGVWQPKKYTGTYGTNGFYLKFADNSGITSTTLGKDSSGNGNNWTPNNFSVTAGAGNDSLIDTPTPYADGGNGRGNYCTWNPLKTGTNLSPEDGNLFARMQSNGSGVNQSATATIYVSSGKWYWEGTSYNTVSGYGQIFGIASTSFTSLNSIGSTNQTYGYEKDGPKYNGTTSSSYGASYTSNDVIGVALDLDAGTLVFYKNGTSQGTAFTGLSGTFTPYCGLTYSGGGPGFYTNFGQRPFAYTPPSGFLALNTQNLPEPSIKKPNQYFDATLYTGNGTNIIVTNSGGFTPDMVWHKGRSVAYSHSIVDAVRGNSNVLSTDTTGAESNPGAQLDITAGGFISTYRSANLANNQNSATYVGWQWKESATPGFDIVTYTGSGTARTIAHTLGVAPSMIIVKERGNANDWPVYHVSTGNLKNLFLNLTNGQGGDTTGPWNGTSPTSSVFSLGTAVETNRNTGTYVAYLWSEVAGFSKFGSYTGNGSTDGPFVHLGFKPAFVMIKRTDVAQDWTLFDNERLGYNPQTALLFPNAAYAESVYFYMDLLSNGFKIRYTSAEYNASGGTYIFAAFAESPFKYSLAR